MGALGRTGPGAGVTAEALDVGTLAEAGAAGAVGGSTTTNQTGSSIGMDGFGKFVVAFEQNDGGATTLNIYSRRFTAAGSPVRHSRQAVAGVPIDRSAPAAMASSFS